MTIREVLVRLLGGCHDDLDRDCIVRALERDSENVAAMAATEAIVHRVSSTGKLLVEKRELGQT